MYCANIDDIFEREKLLIYYKKVYEREKQELDDKKKQCTNYCFVYKSFVHWM